MTQDYRYKDYHIFRLSQEFLEEVKPFSSDSYKTFEPLFEDLVIKCLQENKVPVIQYVDLEKWINRNG